MKDATGAVESVLVFGGSSEIGLATTRALVGHGARRVVLAARAPASLADAADRLRLAGATSVEIVAFDATETDTHAGLARDLFERFGDFDVVLLAFGVLGDPATSASDNTRAVEILRVNLVGAISVALCVAGELRRQGHGTLVVLSSAGAVRVRRSNMVYGASKAGLDGFAQALGDSLVTAGVRVMVVRPGFVRTRMTAGLPPAPLSTSADAVARAIVDGLRRDAEIVWVPAAVRPVMVVLRHLPRAAFRRLPI